MESREAEIDSDGIVDLQVTLDDGPPVPLSLLSDIRNRDGDSEVVVETSRMNVRLKTNGSATPGSNNSNESKMYPGLVVDPR